MEELDSPPQEETSDDWPSRASSMVVQYVDTVRNKTTGPALVASRYAVYFLAIALIGIITLIIGLILLVRLLVVATAELPFVEEGESWLAYLIIGGLCILIGGLLWRKKEPRVKSDDE